MSKISRRDFIKVAGMVAASGTLAACGVAPTEAPAATEAPAIATEAPPVAATSAPAVVCRPTGSAEPWPNGSAVEGLHAFGNTSAKVCRHSDRAAGANVGPRVHRGAALRTGWRNDAHLLIDRATQRP